MRFITFHTHKEIFKLKSIKWKINYIRISINKKISLEKNADWELNSSGNFKINLILIQKLIK